VPVNVLRSAADWVPSLGGVTDGTGVVLGRGAWFFVVVGCLFRGLAGFFGCGGGWWGGFAVGVGWVYCFLSRREGDRRVAGS
jgi:hypothetical protein